jgi:hypothetical protein
MARKNLERTPMPVQQTMVLLLLAIFAGSAHAEEPWRFITLADWHSAEKYVRQKDNPNWLSGAIQRDIDAVKMIKSRYGGDLMLLPGDSNEGEWATRKFLKTFQPGLSPHQAVLQAGDLCYSGMIDAFTKGGYDRLLMAVGDHELGDNPWRVRSPKSRSLSEYRQVLTKAFNRDGDSGAFKYTESIGAAPARPLGTKYEDTSYAYRHKNVLFVTVDTFHHEGPQKRVGSEGTVTGAVTGRHLNWLNLVLAEANDDPTIKHVFVQGHLPVIYPVRKVSSSGMLVNGGTESAFWRTMRRHDVDIYFAGEVHANTVTKDRESDLIQIVSRGNSFDNLLTVDVLPERVEILLHKNEPGSQPADGQYQRGGKLVIDKSRSDTVLTDKGELAFVDPRDRLFHFTFDNIYPLSRRPITGLSGRKNNQKATRIRGVRCSQVIANRGAFGRQYDALQAGIELVDGVNGQAGQFDPDSRMAVFAMGPHQDRHAVSYALWVKTNASKNQLLINSAAIWGKPLAKFFNLTLNDGRPQIMISKNQQLVAEDVALNDGRWHHVVAVMPRDNCRLSDVRLYADGQRLRTTLKGSDRIIHLTQAMRLSFGGMGYSNASLSELGLASFTGTMDEVSIWTRGLRREEVMSLAQEQQY